jgi:GGDEF domain-containing protein
MPSKKLADYREQYPQYKDISDDELAEGIRRTYYPDMPQDKYEELIQLREPVPEPKAATFLEKAGKWFDDNKGGRKDPLADEDVPDTSPRAVLKEFEGPAASEAAIRRRFQENALPPTSAPRDPDRSDRVEDMTEQWNTLLDQTEEQEFQDWRKTLPKPLQSTWDYDLRGAYKAGAKISPDQHMTDKFKKPNHPTFSNQSQYSFDDHQGGTWSPDNKTFTPYQEPVKDERAMWEQLYAGYDEWQANRANKRAFDAAQQSAGAEDVATGVEREDYMPRGPGAFRQLGARRRAAAAQAGDAQAQADIDAEVDAKRAALTTELQAAIDEGRTRRENAATVPFSRETEALLGSKSLGEAALNAMDKPYKIIAELGIRSAPNMLESIPLALAGSVVGGHVGMGAGMGLGSAMTEYRAAFSEYLGKKGVDINNAEAVIEATQDKELMQAAVKYASWRSGIIGLVDAATGGLAGKPFEYGVKTVLGRELANLGTQAGIQTVGGATGELGAQVATLEAGEDLRWGEITAEAMAEVVTSPIDVGAASVTGVRAGVRKRQADEIARQAKEFLDRGGSSEAEPSFPPPTTPPSGPGATEEGPSRPQPGDDDYDPRHDPYSSEYDGAWPANDAARESRRRRIAEYTDDLTRMFTGKEVEPGSPSEAYKNWLEAQLRRLGGEIPDLNPAPTTEQADTTDQAEAAPVDTGVDQIDRSEPVDPADMSFDQYQEWLASQQGDTTEVAPTEPVDPADMSFDQYQEWLASQQGDTTEVAPTEPVDSDENVPTLVDRVPDETPTDTTTETEPAAPVDAEPVDTAEATAPTPEPAETPAPRRPPTPRPPQIVPPHDPRLKRASFRSRLQDMAADLIVDGGVTYTRDERGNINGRTSSGNPPWFQSMMENPRYKMSVRQLQKTVQKAIAGHKLGVREQRVITVMLDEHTDERTDPAELVFVRHALDKAREARRESRSSVGYPDSLEPDGEIYAEHEYPAEMDADTRITFEAMTRAINAGVPVDEVQNLAATTDDEQTLRNILERRMYEAIRAGRTEAGTQEQGAESDAGAGTETAPDQTSGPGEEAPEAPALAPYEKQPGQKKLTPIQADALERIRAFVAKSDKGRLSWPDAKNLGQRTSGKPSTSGQVYTGDLDSMQKAVWNALIDKGYLVQAKNSVAFFEVVQPNEKGEVQPTEKEIDRPGVDAGLDKYADEAPAPNQAGAPNADEAKGNAITAVRQLYDMATILALTISKNLAARQRVSLIGHKLNSDLDVAMISQVFRDPRFETFRLFFTADDGTVLGQLGLSTRMPMSVRPSIPIAEGFADGAGWFDEMKRHANEMGATGIYLMHNHPAGESKASQNDLTVTKAYATALGPMFRGHVVIDTNNYSTITKDGNATRRDFDFGATDLMPPVMYESDTTRSLTNPDNTHVLVRQLMAEGAVGPDDVTLILVDSKLIVRGVTTMPADKITTDWLRTRLDLQRIVLRKGGYRVLAVGRNKAKLDLLNPPGKSPLTTSSYLIGPGDKITVSHSKSGVALVLPAGRYTRVTPGSDARFDYLKDVALGNRLSFTNQARRKQRRAIVAGASTGQFPVMNPAMYPAERGVPFNFHGFRGNGAMNADPNGSHVGFPLFGDQTYYAWDATNGALFGGRPGGYDVTIKNPLVFGSDTQLRAHWSRTADAQLNPWSHKVSADVRADMLKRWAEQMTQQARARGYDGIVIQWDNSSMENGDAKNPSGWKVLRQVFGVPQVIHLVPPPTPTIEDLTGPNNSMKQAIADELRRRDGKRNQGQDSVETGDKGDLFSQAQDQNELFEDAIPAGAIADEQGRPLVMYHGSRPGPQIDQFATRNGAYFTPDPGYAEAFADGLFADEGTAGAMYPVFLTAQNPLIVRAMDGSDAWLNFVERGLDVEAMRAQGQDAAILIDAATGEIDQVFVLSPGQIHTAIGKGRQTNDFDGFDGSRSDPELRQLNSDVERPDKNGRTRAEGIAEMTTDELIKGIFTDQLTGIGNRRAYDQEAAFLKHQAVIDADSLKWVNDKMGMEAGDALLIAIAEALDQTGVQAYRIGGDEFVLGSENADELEAALRLAEGILAGQTVRSDRGMMPGIKITWGIGPNKSEADATMKGKKDEKERAGTRAARGERPPGATLSVQNNAMPRMAPGTNYVPMIGKMGKLPINANNLLVLGNGRTVRIPKLPVRREHIIAVMRKYFGNRIYQGRVKGRGTLGFYLPGQGATRIKFHNDIEVAAHEIAHYIDDRHPWVRQLYRNFKQELRGVSYDATSTEEGFAEFMRLFLTQETEAMSRAPSFYNAWQAALAQHPTLGAAVWDLQELMHAWTMQGARARFASKTGTAIPAFIQKIKELWPSSWTQASLDGLRGIKKIGQRMNSPQVMKAYEKLRIAIGGHNGVLEAAFFWGTPGYRADGRGLEFTGEGLKDIFGDFWGNDSMGNYMLARRARELMEQGREILWRPDEIASWLTYESENPEAAGIWDRYQDYNKRMLDFAQAAGVLSAKSRKAMEEMNKNYVPFYRVLESLADGRKLKASGNPFMRLKGGSQNVGDIWENIIQQNGNLIRFAMVNDGKRDLFRVLGDRTGRMGGNAGGLDPLAGVFAAPIGTDTKPVEIDSEQITKLVVELMGYTMKQYRFAKSTGMYSGPQEAALVALIDSMVAGLEPMTQFWQFNQDPSGDVTYYLENGEKKWFEVIDRDLWDSMEFLGPKGTNLALMIVGGFSAALRRGTVAIPTFQTINFVRDSTQAWMLSSRVHVPFFRALRVVFSRLHEDQDYQLMLLNGGGFSSRSQGLEAQRRTVVNPTHLFAIYDRFMGRFENANRLAEFKANLEEFGPRHSAFLSREISTDFAMKGSSEIARFLAIAVPFMNARVQGMYRNKRALDTRESAINLAVKGALLTTATLALYALNKDDERYKELPEDVKDLNWVFFNGTGEDDYFLLPKPFELGNIFATLPERFMEYLEKQDGKEFADAISWMFLQAFALDPTPQVFQPELDLSRNKDFTGAPIVPEYLQGVDASQQFQYYTSRTMIEAGKKMGISPIEMDYRVRGYFGTLGTWFLAASDELIKANSDPYVDVITGEVFPEGEYGFEPTRGETWKENIVVKGTIDRFVNEGPTRRSKHVNDLYEMVERAEEVAKTSSLMMKRVSMDAAEYLSKPENQFELALIKKQGLADPPLLNATEFMRTIRVAQDNIRMSRQMTGDEKRLAIWELTRERNKYARDVVEAIQRAKQEMAEKGIDPQAAIEGVSKVSGLADQQPMQETPEA